MSTDVAAATRFPTGPTQPVDGNHISRSFVVGSSEGSSLFFFFFFFCSSSVLPQTAMSYGVPLRSTVATTFVRNAYDAHDACDDPTRPAAPNRGSRLYLLA